MNTIREIIDTLTVRQKAVLILIGLLIAVLAANYAIGTFNAWRKERSANDAVANADDREKRSNAAVQDAARDRQRIAELEADIQKFSAEKRKQDELLTETSKDVSAARDALRRSRGRERTANIDAETLCRRLAELGHPCG